jgi:hypothetical protein
MAITESEIIDLVYSLYEGDQDTWASTSDEYLTARRYAKAAILRWEYESGVLWPQLYKRLSSASDGDKTTSVGDYTYTCPADMRLPPKGDDKTPDYVWIDSLPFVVYPLSKVQQLKNSQGNWCYFTGNQKDGFTLNFNPNITLPAGTLTYDYYKQATYYTTPTSTTEMENPMYIVHYVLSRFYKNDGLTGESTQEMQLAEQMVEQMKENTFVIVEDSLNDFGFGQ